MLDGLLGRSGFSSKCKSLIKPTRTRIDVLRRRAEAKQRFLKEDLAKLLANGLDVNAYGRTEDFIAGLNMLSCYNFIDQSCEYILKQLSVMQKLGQCPEECRETVASLMFAAARFSDLPELRDLRDVFQDRYGNGLECYVNQVFIEKLASKPPVVEKKIKLLQDISAEFSIQWDSKGFKQRMDSPSTLAQDQARKLGPSSVNDDKYKVPNENNVFRKNDQRYKERTEPIYDKPTLPIGENVNVRRKEVLDIPFVQREEKHAQDQTRKVGPSIGTDDKYKSPKENNIFHKNHHPSKQSVDHTNEGPPLHNSAGNSNFRRKEVLDIPFVGREEKRSHKAEVYLSKPRPESDSNNGIKKLQLKEDDVKSIEEKQPVTLLKPCYNTPLPPPPYTKPNTHHHHHQPPSSGDLPPPYSGRRKKDQKDQNDIPLPKPRSVRKKHSKSSSSHDDVGSSEDSRIVKRISSSRRKERKGLQILFDDEHYHYKDDDEKMMDKLLLHYSKKPSAYDGKLRKKKSSKSPVELETETETNVPVRSISLPHESEPKKVYARANSFQPDNQAPHVHPKLPDYDDLAARFAALRGR